jgi:hypothetical protein
MNLKKNQQTDKVCRIEKIEKRDIIIVNCQYQVSEEDSFSWTEKLFENIKSEE